MPEALAGKVDSATRLDLNGGQSTDRVVHQRLGPPRSIRIADDYVILSDDFIALYDKLRAEMAGDPYNDLPPEQRHGPR